MNMLNWNKYEGFAPQLRDALAGVQLPVIRGNWYFVDPYGATYPADLPPGQVFTNILDAYNACVSGQGDGILVFSGGTSAAHTTSYLKYPLDWTKHNITVFGVCAPTRTYQRARISNLVVTKTATTISYTADHTISDSGSGFVTAGFVAGQYLAITNADSNTNDFNVVAEGGSADFIKISSVTASTITTTSTSAHVTTEAAAAAGSVVLTSYDWYLIKVSGNNNSFYNLHLTQSDATAYALDALVVTGLRNYFYNVHAAIGLASAATVLARSLYLNAAEENTFVDCTFGTDTVDRGNNATYDIRIYGVVKRNVFQNCTTLKYVSTGTVAGAVMLDSTVGGHPTIFDNCKFTCNNVTQLAKAVLLTGSNSKHWFVGGTCFPGYAAQGGALVVYNTAPTTSTAGVGGVGTTPAS